MNGAEKVLVRRRRQLLVAERDGLPRIGFVASLMRNLESIGFTFSAPVVERLQRWDPGELLALAEDLVPLLLREVGGHVRYRPMYPNFPQQVMEADEAELYLNAFLHYYGDAIGERILPQYRKQGRAPMAIPTDLTVIGLAPEGAVVEMARAMMGSHTSLSASDVGDLRTLLSAFREDLDAVLPAAIPFREIRATVCAHLLAIAVDPEVRIGRYVDTATDVLRLVTECSRGDVSLAARTKYRSFKRSERRCILGLLERCANRFEDMSRHRGKWLRVGERLHPGDFSRRFPKAWADFSALRRGERAPTFNSRVESALDRSEFDQAVALLARRPGELARRLDHLIRSMGEPGIVLRSFETVAPRVSTPVLLQILAHFRERQRDQEPRRIEDVAEADKQGFFDRVLDSLRKPSPRPTAPLSPMRTVFPKGVAGKLVRIPRVTELIDPEIAGRVVAMSQDALRQRFSELPAIGKAYVDPQLARFVVPFSQRSASKSLLTLARGSRLPLPDAPTVRFFLWWKEGEVAGKPTGRVDIDLSATFYSAAWRYRGHVSYTNLKSARFGTVHSGDITSAPNGACEFIDVDLSRARSAGARYLITSVQAFTSQPFCDLPECFAGWMARREPASGEVFEPATVKDKVDLGANGRISVPVVIDLEEREVYWADLALRSHPNHAVNIESNQRGLVHYGVAITTMVKPTLQDLFELHVQARGEAVGTADEADTVFAVTEGVTPFDGDKIVSEFLA